MEDLAEFRLNFSDLIWGYGLGLTLDSPFGPLEFVWSRGDSNINGSLKKRNHFYIKAGYNF